MFCTKKLKNHATHETCNGDWSRCARFNVIRTPIQKHKREISKLREEKLPRGLCCDCKVHSKSES